MSNFFNRNTKYLIISLLSFVVLLCFLSRNINSANSTSRLATIDSLVNGRTFCIANSQFFQFTVDKVKINGSFYSSKPPLHGFILSVPYFLFSRMTGINFSNNVDVSVQFVNLISGVLPHLILLLYFFQFRRYWMLSADSYFFCFCAIALSTLSFGYATSINNHSVSALMLFVAFFHMFLVVRVGRRESYHWFLIGLMLGLIPAIDQLQTILFSISFLYYLWKYDRYKTLLFTVPVFLFVLIIHFSLYKHIFGMYKPVQLEFSLFKYPGSYWNNPIGMDRLDESKIKYFFHILIGHHGFFSMTPLFILGFISLIKSIRSKMDAFHFEAIIIFIPTVILFLGYGIGTKNYGGNCVGFRWLILVTPLLILFSGRWLNEKSNAFRYFIFLFLMGIGALNNISALKNPWSTSAWHKIIEKYGDKL